MACWMSYNSNWDPLLYGQFGSGCMISVALDAGAHESFAGIRLLIVCRDDGDLADVTLKACLDPTNKYRIGQQESPTTYRQLLSRREYNMEQRRQVLSDHTLPLCTVVFELVKLSIATVTVVNLFPLDEQRLSSQPQRIFYERIYPCTPTRHSFVIYLDSSHSFGEDVWISMLGLPLPCVYRKTLVEHSIRIIPIYAVRPQLGVLPRHVLRQIARCACDRRHVGWRKNLLAMAMVCKGWSHILDIFFSDLSSYGDYSGPVIAVARSLEARPDRARLIHTLSSSAFDLGHSLEDEAQIKRSKALISILRRVTSVKKVMLSNVHKSDMPAAIDALSQLREMEEFVVSCEYTDSLGSKYSHFTMIDLQRAVANSRSLRVFSVSDWRDLSDVESRDVPDGEIPPPTQLETLRFSVGCISGSRLLHFAAPRLSEATFERVTGLINSDLLAFLSQVAPTLKKLVIRSTVIPRTSADEEYALDAVMPLMMDITHLKIQGDLASALALTRKPASPPGQTAKFVFISVSTNVIGMDSIIAAAEVTRWSALTLFRDSESAWSENDRKRAYDMGRRRGIIFRFPNSMITRP